VSLNRDSGLGNLVTSALSSGPGNKDGDHDDGGGDGVFYGSGPISLAEELVTIICGCLNCGNSTVAMVVNLAGLCLGPRDTAVAGRSVIKMATHVRGSRRVLHGDLTATDRDDHCFGGDDVVGVLACGRGSGAQSWLMRLPAVEVASGPRDPATRYVVTSVDDRGRLADRSLVRVLDWESQRRFEVSVLREMVIVTARSSGIRLVTRQGYLRLPPFIRRGLGLVAGSRLLLAANLEYDRVVAFTTSALDAMTLAHCTALVSKAGG